MIVNVGRLFVSEGMGRILVLLQHPVERTASLIYYLQEARWSVEGGR